MSVTDNPAQDTEDELRDPRRRIRGRHGSDSKEPAQVDDGQWEVECLCGDKFRGATSTEAILARRVHAYERDAAGIGNELERLTNFILDKLPDEPGSTGKSESAVDVAIRVLTQFLENPNGRLEPSVRAAIAQIEQFQTEGDDVLDANDILTSLRVNLKTYLMSSSAGTEEHPFAVAHESDDIALVRFDRDRLRVAYQQARRTIADLHAAATGKRGRPERGLVHDVAQVRARLDAAENALTIALSHRCEQVDARVDAVLSTQRWTTMEKLLADRLTAIGDAARKRR